MYVCMYVFPLNRFIYSVCSGCNSFVCSYVSYTLANCMYALLIALSVCAVLYVCVTLCRQLSRLGTSDDMEHNMSTFFTEMKETAYILANVTSRSLVIIDELGRGTSNIDGTVCTVLFFILTIHTYEIICMYVCCYISFIFI